MSGMTEYGKMDSRLKISKMADRGVEHPCSESILFLKVFGLEVVSQNAWDVVIFDVESMGRLWDLCSSPITNFFY